MSPSAKKISIDEYNSFIEQIELVDIYISELRIKRMGNLPEKQKNPFKVTLKPTRTEYKKLTDDLYEITHRVLFKLDYKKQNMKKSLFWS